MATAIFAMTRSRKLWTQSKTCFGGSTSPRDFPGPSGGHQPTRISHKSRRGSRAVPLAPSLATELQAHLKRSQFQGYDDLVFGHLETGEVLVHATVGQPFKKALSAAGLRKCASTTFATPTEPRWPRLACRCEPFRSGWAIAISRRRSSTPTTNPARVRAVWSTKPSPDFLGGSTTPDLTGLSFLRAGQKACVNHASDDLERLKPIIPP